jgi:hypothetical protein
VRSDAIRYVISGLHPDKPEATEKIDAKETFHFVDACRYIIGYLNRDKPKGTYGNPVAFKGLQNL